MNNLEKIKSEPMRNNFRTTHRLRNFDVRLCACKAVGCPVVMLGNVSAEINERIKSGDAIVLTAQEVCDTVKSGENLILKDVDVVTTATRAIMSEPMRCYLFLWLSLARMYAHALYERMGFEKRAFIFSKKLNEAR